ncbi:MAG: hypothetical protein RL071_727 [Pseudomonadota bacterium]|jgi:hypothetical protein
MFQWLMRLLGLAQTPPPSPAPPPPAAPDEPPRAAVVLPLTPVDASAEATRAAPPTPRAVTAQAPWRRGAPAPALDLAAVRGHLRFTLDELAGRASNNADRALPEQLNRLISTDQLDLPPFPDVARELDELLKQTTTDILQIARVVERDPGLVRRVWTHARSAAYSAAPRSLHHAVARVGLDALWRIGMSVCLNEATFKLDGMQDQADRVRQHGIVAAEVAALLGGERRGALYLSGLLHGAGELIVLRATSSLPHPRPSPMMIQQVIEATRAPLGVLVATSWNLGPTAAAGIGFFPAPDLAPAADRATARIVRAASIAATATAPQLVGAPPIDPELAAADIRELGLDATAALRRADEVWRSLGESADPTA